MYSKFLSLKPEKQERILDAAIKEFARKGYDKASTNEIVKEADISKGLLFHYFQNKKNLFLFLYQYCIDLTLNEYYKKINWDDKDIFLRLRKSLKIKLELMNRYPKIFVFLEVSYYENSNELKKDLEQINQKFTTNAYGKIFENIDTSKFKDNIDIKKATDIIIWTFDGLSVKERKKGKLLSLSKIDYEKAFNEADLYIELLKNSFYK